MTARTIRLKARDVVEGMKNTEGMTVTGIDRDNETVAFRFGPVDTTMDLDLDAMVDVMLSGPSPRELLCQCAGQSINPTEIETFDPVTGKHAKGCPADGFRVWPVGATWSPTSELRAADLSETGCWMVDGIAVWRSDISSDFAGIEPECAAMLRAAFCEPE